MGFAAVAELGTFAAAVAAADELRPDAALLDVHLPDGDGDGVALAATWAALPSPPRDIVTSSDVDAVSASAARDGGAIGFIAKVDWPGESLRAMFAGE